MARTAGAIDVKTARQRRTMRPREEGHQATVAGTLTPMRSNSHLLLLRELRQHRQALKVASSFINSSTLARRVRDLQDEHAELESYRQMLRQVMDFNRQKRQVRERHLAVIPESDCEHDA
ncbi:hypothetical protein CVIRNUC_007112 [Coccomyxa viridis]|uniref:Uncharacterized protein n=1 Tax=Coccomyxa viridis TaxID=1274662 RepID=A0AAV1ICE3_9CHLO|nr:hypothetical protein CVIRNUC_007112 [Coccomyxa viridis]